MTCRTVHPELVRVGGKTSAIEAGATHTGQSPSPTLEQLGMESLTAPAIPRTVRMRFALPQSRPVMTPRRASRAATVRRASDECGSGTRHGPHRPARHASVDEDRRPRAATQLVVA